MGALVAIACLSAGCHRTFRGSVVQPSPLSEDGDARPVSERVVIVTGDMELNVPRLSSGPGPYLWVNERYPLSNAARFVVLSRDRLRFQVQIEHKWQEWADPSTWTAYLVDDRGRRYRPEVVDGDRPRHLVSVWDYETRTAIRDGYGDIVAVLDDGHARRNPLASLSVFRGQGDFVFHAPDGFAAGVRRLTLVLERDTTAFAFTWQFEDAPADARGSGPVTARR